jgi:hypothetical protein
MDPQEGLVVVVALVCLFLVQCVLLYEKHKVCQRIEAAWDVAIHTGGWNHATQTRILDLFRYARTGDCGYEDTRAALGAAEHRRASRRKRKRGE